MTISCTYLVALLQIVSGVYLGLAILKIRKFLNGKAVSENSDLLNNGILAINSFACGLFVLSIALWQVFITYYGLEAGSASIKNAIYVNICNNLISFTAQFCLFVIFW